jgi:hypothetical protein
MWLHVPKCALSRSALGSGCMTLHSEQCLLLEQFVTSSGKHSPQRSWSGLWKRASWMRRLSGLTLPPSRLEDGAASWMRSLQDCLASPTARQAANSAMKIRGRSGVATARSRTSSASYPSVDPPWSSSRTSQIGFDTISNGFDLSATNYAEWVTRSKNRSSSVRRMLARRINANAFGSWPTSRAEDAESCQHPIEDSRNGSSLTDAVRKWPSPRGMDSAGAGYMNQRDGTTRPMLAGMAENWPTPDANVSTQSNKSQSPNAKVRPNLAALAPLWSTPMASEAHTRPQSFARGNQNLAGDAETWATPTTRMEKGGSKTSEIRKDGKSRLDQLDYQAENYSRRVLSAIDGQELSNTTRILRPRLNPAFAAWLMGLPGWWTSPAVTSSVQSAMAAFRCVLQLHGQRLLGE